MCENVKNRVYHLLKLKRLKKEYRLSCLIFYLLIYDSSNNFATYFKIKEEIWRQSGTKNYIESYIGI